jgi:diketogulonate reductase-like aldo/keto reductase
MSTQRVVTAHPPLRVSEARKTPQRKRTIDLNDGHEIPQIALGVYKAPNGQETEDAIIAALDAGYRHIDSAARYLNEEACGRLAIALNSYS